VPVAAVGIWTARSSAAVGTIVGEGGGGGGGGGLGSWLPTFMYALTWTKSSTLDDSVRKAKQETFTLHARGSQSCLSVQVQVQVQVPSQSLLLLKLQLRSRRTFLRELTLWNYYSPRIRTPQHGSVRTRDVGYYM
jgi:hypothetical protein